MKVIGNERGVSLIELLITMVIALVALSAATTPFVAERSFWTTGNRRVEAQRDAQLVMHSIARVARESNDFIVNGNTLTFTSPAACDYDFQNSGTQFQMVKRSCITPAQTIVLLDGTKSVMTQFVPTEISTKVVQIQLEVTREGQEKEKMETQIFLRNG